jgi:hypothetical protein
MADEPKTMAVRTLDRLKAIASIFKTPEISETKTSSKRLGRSSTFSRSELLTLSKANKAVPVGDSFESLKKEMHAVSARVQDHIDDNKSFQAMVPEIGKARTVLVPSIMNPSDMYGTALTFNITAPELDDKVKNSIVSLLDKHFNSTIHIGDQIAEWVGEALFDAGSAPVMIVPRKLISVLAAERKPQVGTGAENLVEDPNHKPSLDDLISISCEDIQEWDAINTESLSISLEGASAISSTKVKRCIKQSGGLKKKQVLAEESLTGVATEALNSVKNTVAVTLDFRKLSDTNKVVKKSNQTVEDKLKRIMTSFGSDKVVSIDGKIPPDKDDAPLIYKLPASSVIPVHVPGSPNTHIGYFVIIDEYGNPINERPSINTEVPIGTPFLTTLDKLISEDSNSSSKKYHAMSMVFEMTLRDILKTKLKDVGIRSAELPDAGKLFTCIFNRSLAKEKVSMLYVPTSHMTYYAYEYRTDGTGKGMMEDSSFLIGLRTSFLIAKVMGAIEQATDNRTITFSMENASGSSLEQVMGMLKDAYISKRMYSLDHNPMNVMRDIVSRGISIVPKNVKGIPNLDIETATTQGSGSKGDPEMEEILTNFIVTTTKVPAAVMNELGEHEFSRSVATTNIIFSNFVRHYQNITCTKTEPLVRAYINNSYHLVAGIKNILKESTVTIKDDIEFKRMFNYIVANVTVSLPPPNVSPNKAKFTELKDIMESVDMLVSKLLPDEMINNNPNADNMKATLQALRADMVSKLVKDALVQVGATTLVDLDKIAALDIKSLMEFNHMLINYTEAFTKQSAVVKSDASKKEDTSEDDQPDSKW